MSLEHHINVTFFFINSAFQHVMKHVIRMPHKCYNSLHKLVRLVSLKSPVGIYDTGMNLPWLNIDSVQHFLVAMESLCKGKKKIYPISWEGGGENWKNMTVQNERSKVSNPSPPPPPPPKPHMGIGSTLVKGLGATRYDMSNFSWKTGLKSQNFRVLLHFYCVR